MKGCFTHSTGCSNTDCVDFSQVEKKEKQKLNFCCCKGSLCNSKYSWEPITQATTEIGTSTSKLKLIFSVGN